MMLDALLVTADVLVSAGMVTTTGLPTNAGHRLGMSHPVLSGNMH